MDLTITVSRRRDEGLVEVTGALDHAAAPYLRQVVYELFDGGAHDIAVEVSRTRLLDGAAIKVLGYLRRRGEQLACDVHLAGAHGIVLTALEIACAAKELRAYDEVDWPLPQREPVPVDLGALPLAPGHWPPDATDRLARMRELGPAERARARDELIMECLPVARRLARRYAGAAEPPEDLSQVAALGLVKAVDGFDPGYGVEFGGYATPTIVGELKRHFRDRTGGVRLPRRLQELRLAVDQSRDGLTQALGRVATTADLAAELGVEEQRVVEAVGAALMYWPLSLDGPAPGPCEDPLLDALGAESPDYGLVEHRVALDRMLTRLPEREQRIVIMRFYGGLTQAQIAEQVGLSQMHVSRLLRHALDFLHRRLTE